MNEKIEIDENEHVPGDEIYKSIGFSPVDSVVCSIFLVPPTKGGRMLVGYRLTVSFSDEAGTLEKIIPIDDLLGLMVGLSDALSTDVLRAYADKIHMLSVTQEDAIASLEETITKITDFKKFLAAQDIERKDDIKT